MIKINDKCRLLCDWIPPEVKTKRVQVIRLQKNGRQKFARIIWLGKNARQNEQEYGVLFSLEELRKI